MYIIYRWLCIFLFLPVGVALFLVGLFFSVLDPAITQYRLYSQESLPVLTMALLTSSQPGEQVLIEGRVSARNSMYEYNSRFHNLVLYEVWELSQGQPHVIARVMPPFSVDLPDGAVRIINDDYHFEVGEEFSAINEYLKGFSAGDPILIFGTIVHDRDGAAFHATSIDQHSRHTYFEIRQFQRNNALYLVVPGLLSLVIGLLFLQIGIKQLRHTRYAQDSVAGVS
jgi:hypothetical protein